MPIPFAIVPCRIGNCVEQRSHHLAVEVCLDEEVGRCPECGQMSRSVHSRYHRYPADLPISTSRTTLSIEVRRFYCLNACCPRRTFAEQASDLVAPRARRTRRLAETQGRVGIVCGGAPGARLLKHLRMPASRATVLRLVRAMSVPETPAAEPSLPSARQLAWPLVQATSALDAAAAAVVARVEQDATASAVATLARRFTALVRASGVGRAPAPGRNAAAEFNAWTTMTKACSAPAIATFAAGLDGDAAAVRTALTETWSSGQEGQIDWLKLIKRQSYGRAGLDLLQRRMVLAA